MGKEVSPKKVPETESEEDFSWAGEAWGQSSAPAPSDHVRLPVGLRKDGSVFRQVVIDELSGIDDHLVSGKKAGNNGAKGMSLVLCRAVQEVEGLLKKKQDPEKQFDRGFARALSQPDRDYLITRIFMLSGNDDAVMAGECPRCERVWEEQVRLSELPVIEWPDDEECKIEFELEVGVPEKTKGGETVYHKTGMIRFPTGKEQEMVGELDNMATVLDATLAACILSLGTLGRINQEQAKRLKRRDREKLMVTLQQQLPGIRQWKEVKCQCGCPFDIRLDLASFFGGRRRTMKK